MNKSQEKVMFDSPDAAKYVKNISGWVDRHGRFFGDDENLARYSGCTHRPCRDCGSPTTKSWLSCDACRDKKDIEKYNAMPKKIWNGEVMLFSESADQYFHDLGEIEDYLSDSDGMTINDLRLVICEPNYLSQIDEDQWCDDLPEDGELPESIVNALADFNQAIKDEGPVSWSPGKYAAIVEETDHD